MKVNKPLAKKTKRSSAAPAVQTKAQPRELTRAEKTAAAREAAAKRNAAKIAPQKNTQDAATSRGQKSAKARDDAAKRNAARVTPPSRKAPVNKSIGNKPTARRTLSSRSQSKQEQIKTSRQEINRKINTQTPAYRQEAKTKKKVSGSVKNIEIKTHKKSANHSFRVKKKQQRTTKLLLSRLILFFIIFIIMFSVVAGLFSMSLRSGKGTQGKEYTLQLGADLPEDKTEVAEKDKPVYMEIPKSCATRYGNLYIPVSALSDLCELTVTGTLSDLRYLPRESEGHSMRFIVDSDIAYVNGAKIRMISPSFIHEGKLYIPLDFMQKYSNGLSIETDEGNRKITVSKLLEGYDAATDSDIYSVLSFNLSATLPLTPIEEPVQ
ncbi:MAG: hypothetical protein IJB57_02615 [Clostridia bacterium]|nr:hypothetical protein [Clostridia bacterium]